MIISWHLLINKLEEKYNISNMDARELVFELMEAGWIESLHDKNWNVRIKIYGLL